MEESISIINVTLYAQIDYSFWFNTIKLEWSIVYIEGSQFIISKRYCICSLKIDFVLANSADPDEMPHHAAFHLGLRCLPKYPFRGFRSTKG